METGRLNIIKKVDLSSIYQGKKEIEEKIRTAFTFNSASLNNTLQHVREELISESSALYRDINQLSQTVGGKSRQRRGLFNIGGEGLKFLFGTMSNRDEKQIAKSIAELENNQEQTMKRIKTAVAVMSNLNQANLVMRQNQEKERATLNKVVVELKNKIDAEKAEEDIQELHNSLSRWIYSLRMEVKELHDAMLFLKSGVIDPFIVEEDEIVNAMGRGAAGYTIKQGGLEELFRASTLHSFMNETSKTIYIIIGVPVLGNSSSDLFSITRVPQRANGKRIIIKEAKRYLLVSEDKRNYWIGDNFSHVKVGDTIIGHQIPMSSLNEGADCEVTVFQFGVDRGCVYHDWDKQWEVEIITNRGHLLVWFNIRQIWFECDKEKGNLTISEPTLIRIKDDCAVQGEGFRIERTAVDSDIGLEDLVIKIGCCTDFDLDNNLGVTREKVNTSYNLMNFTDMDRQIRDLQSTLYMVHLAQYHPITLLGIPVGVLVAVTAIIWVVWYIRIRRARAVVDLALEEAVVRNNLRNMGLTQT